MMSQKLTSYQFFLLVFLFTIGSSILFVPSEATLAAGRDAWLSIGIGMGFNVIIVGMYLLLSSLYPGKNLFDIIRQLNGRWIGSFVILAVILFSFLICVTNVFFYVGFFLKTQIFPDTPFFILNSLFMVIVIVALRLGLVTFSRAAEMLTPLFLFLFAIMIVFVTPEMNFDELKPVFSTKMPSLLRGALTYSSYSVFPLIFFLIIYPQYVSNPRKAAHGFIWGSLLGGVVLGIVTVACITVIGEDITPHYTFPSYVLAQRVNIGDYFTRIEVIMPTIWMISLFYKMLIYFYSTIEGITRLIPVQSNRIFIFPLSIIALALSVDLYDNSAQFQDWSMQTWPVISLFFGVVLPLILLGIALIQKWRQKQVSNG